MSILTRLVRALPATLIAGFLLLVASPFDPANYQQVPGNAPIDPKVEHFLEVAQVVVYVMEAMAFVLLLIAIVQIFRTPKWAKNLPHEEFRIQRDICKLARELVPSRGGQFMLDEVPGHSAMFIKYPSLYEFTRGLMSLARTGNANTGMVAFRLDQILDIPIVGRDEWAMERYRIHPLGGLTQRFATTRSIWKDQENGQVVEKYWHAESQVAYEEDQATLGLDRASLEDLLYIRNRLSELKRDAQPLSGH